jgi:hypothetical protein
MNSNVRTTIKENRDANLTQEIEKIVMKARITRG